MRGHIRQRSPGHWAIILDIHKEGIRKRKWHSFKGTKREAQDECARLISAMKEGAYVEANKLTVGQYLLDRLAQWEGSNKIDHKTAERYRCAILTRHSSSMPVWTWSRSPSGWDTAGPALR
jgi:hypothetical protein